MAVAAKPSPPANGITRYTVTGHHFKGVSDDDGNTLNAGAIRDQPWTVIAPVATAIDILERLEDNVLLFPREVGSVLKNGKPRHAYRGAGLTPTHASTRIAKFIEYANRLATGTVLPTRRSPQIRTGRSTCPGSAERSPGSSTGCPTAESLSASNMDICA